MEMLGIKETKEMVVFLIGMGNALGESLEDGKISIMDIASFASPMMDASEAFSDSKKIPAELADLDEMERQELVAYVKEKFDIPEKCCEDIIKSAFETLSMLALLVQKCISHKKEGK